MKNNDKDRNIYDNGFDRFLSRGDNLPLAKNYIHPDFEDNGIMRGIIQKTEYKNGVLFFSGKKIDFNNKPNQKELLDIIFEEPSREWFYDEIADRWDELKKLNLIKLPKNYWKRFDTAGIGINKIVAIETGIKDFIIKNTKKTRVNPKYIV